MKDLRKEARDIMKTAQNDSDINSAISKLNEGMKVANSAYNKINSMAEGDNFFQHISGFLIPTGLPDSATADTHVYGNTMIIDKNVYNDKNTDNTKSSAKRKILLSINLYKHGLDMGLKACKKALSEKNNDKKRVEIKKAAHIITSTCLNWQDDKKTLDIRLSRIH